jgi:hypothetical protein
MERTHELTCDIREGIKMFIYIGRLKKVTLYACMTGMFLFFISITTFAEKYASHAKSGIVTFDYSNNNGRYFIGSGVAKFEVDFSNASNRSIHVYKDPESIKKIALAYEANTFSKIGDARKLDYSSRTRTPQTNEIVVLVNQSDYYAAIHITEIKARSHGKKRDEVTFSYRILKNKSSVFR